MAKQGIIIGAGDLGLRVAMLRAGLGDAVCTLRRRTLPVPSGVQAVTGDLHSAHDLARLPVNADWMVFCATPDSRNASAYRHLYVDGFRKARDLLQPKHCLFVSSTAVYGQNHGEWVDETSTAEAETFNGLALREAERICLQESSARVLRLSGITGPGRNMLINKALLGTECANVWSNRIHISDAAAAVSHVLELSAAEPLWIATDDTPALQCDVLNWIRQCHDLPPLPYPDGLTQGRRISNARLKASGWQPRYASYRQSYALSKPEN